MVLKEILEAKETIKILIERLSKLVKDKTIPRDHRKDFQSSLWSASTHLENAEGELAGTSWYLEKQMKEEEKEEKQCTE